jgi:cytoskeletal protein RodZ
MMNDQRPSLALSTIRRNRGISLQQIADATKISLRSLEAIEQGADRKLSGGIYNTSYIKQYARAIDYDEAELLSAYHRAMTAPAASASSGRKPDRTFGIFRTASGTL